MLLKWPENHQVMCNDPEGVYFNPRREFDDGRVQLIVVGPMTKAPREYAIDLFSETRRSYRLISSSFLKGTGETAEVVLQRGFISLEFEELK